MSSDSWRAQVQRAPRSALITIKNYTHFPLARVNYNLQSGAFRLFPQEIIPPYAEVQFASTNKGVLSGTDGTVIYKALISQLEVSFAFWFRNPFVDPRQAKCTVEQSNLASKFQIQQTEVSDNHYEVTWCIYTTLTKEEATPLDASDLEATEDQAWMKEQTKASRSVTVTVRNSTQTSFYRKKFELNRGSWTCLPPDVFLPGKTASFGAKGSSLMTGTTGRVVYQSEASNETLEIFYDNPFIGEIQVVHSRPLDFRLDVAYRKQEHLRITVGIFPVSESAEVEKETDADAAVLSSSPSSSASSALPLHKVQPSAATAPKSTPQLESTSTTQKTPATARSPRLPSNQLVSGEEDEEDATIAATARRDSRSSIDSNTPRSKSRRQLQDDSTPAVPKLRRQGTSEKLASSSARVSLDLVHNAARFRLFGVPLAVIVEKENLGENVPKIVSEICSHISDHGSESVGLFVQPGMLREVLAIRAEYERGDASSPDLSRYQLHSVATVLKMFFRELPTPLIPPKQHSAFIEFVATDTPLPIPAHQFYTKFVSTLPIGHKETFRTVFKMLKVMGSSPACDLGYEDSGVVFAPIISPDSSTSQRMGQWTGAIVARAITTALECFDDIDFGAQPEPNKEQEITPSMMMSTSPKLKSRSSSRSDSSKSKGSPKTQRG
eukprot:TRINITY_DN4292_c0_g1_i2.p1 TRINITY_DN4292_c0_g1~~TRINITY_DN4292_c0_g1_i2.p1  ORF type:complete len:666 (+),score=95.77 TRINITY_DN4292_c0_g1_i2:109-2106(+)